MKIKKTFMIIISLISTLGIILLLTGCEKDNRLSSECDRIICTGRDENGNYYELVGNQYENALGTEIRLGIIKNNTWLVELSSSFPFLGDDGLFHLVDELGGISNDDLFSSYLNSSVQFIEPSTFVIKKYYESETLLGNDKSVLCFFSCKTLQSAEIDLTKYVIPKMYMEGYYADNSQLLIYSKTSNNISGWLEDQTFDWILFDISTFEMKTIGKNIKGVRPERPLSEGLIYASDECFYNINMQKVIDLSHYKIDSLPKESELCFNNERCRFIATNPQGKRFWVVIDKSGNVISESPYN